MPTSPEKNSSTPPSVPSSEPFPSRFPGPASGVAVRSSGGRREIGGPSGPEPTRFGDWERKGRCIDF
ncbi:MAG: DUF1674 domain-containing protein [Gammaproteobacteria bacterium]|nr:DUF1674 domain-containing protein [Gammaproteobacteria bacterium]